MEKLRDLLKGNFWVIPSEFLTFTELEFLKDFFNITQDFNISEGTFQKRDFYILEKKKKFLTWGLTN